MNKFFPEIKKNFGFGCMRLPMKGGRVDTEQMCAMVDLFLERMLAMEAETRKLNEQCQAATGNSKEIYFSKLKLKLNDLQLRTEFISINGLKKKSAERKNLSFVSLERF